MSPTNRGYSPAAAPGRATMPSLLIFASFLLPCHPPSLLSIHIILPSILLPLNYSNLMTLCVNRNCLMTLHKNALDIPSPSKAKMSPPFPSTLFLYISLESQMKRFFSPAASPHLHWQSLTQPLGWSQKQPFTKPPTNQPVLLPPVKQSNTKTLKHSAQVCFHNCLIDLFD